MASSKDGDSDGSFTPSDGSDSEEHSERDSDYESEEEEHRNAKSVNIQWTGYAKKTPVILFNSDCVVNKRINMRSVGERYHMAYKFGNSECKIVRNIFNGHGFHEVHPNSSDYNLVWTGAHLKPFTLRSLSEFQKINHFPRSYELTRKDRLYKNLQRMQQIKGTKHFDIIPASFVLPGEYQEFCSAFLKDKGPWIVKPVASSRGRGIFLVNHPDQIPLDENIIVCRYLSNPLLIDGFKFDVRLYVAVTSYDPLLIYLYEEGLTRFATVKYEKSSRHIRNHCMHLTNYSVNKKNDEYVKNDDADIEDYGNKWSLGAMLRYLKSNGKDTAALMMKIEDCIIKTILSVELPIATACKMFMPFKGNCFELYGFDILIDDNLKPWVLEVNLSPSLACDSPLDMKIKGNMLCDLFSLTGIICHDPMMRTLQQSRRNQEVANKMAARAKSARVRATATPMKQRPASAGSLKKGADNSRDPSGSTNKAMAGLNSDEIRVVRRAKEEDARKGGWVRIFPTADSWDLYSSFLQFSTSNNLMIHQKLYPERHKSVSSNASSRGSTSAGSRAKSVYIQLATNSGAVKPTLELAAAYAQALLRTRRYERKLGTKRYRDRRKRRTADSRRDRRKLVQGVQEESGEDQDQEEQEDNEDEEPPITERNITDRNNQMSKTAEPQTQVQQPPETSQKEDMIQIVVEQNKKAQEQRAGDKKTGLAALARSNTDLGPSSNHSNQASSNQGAVTDEQKLVERETDEKKHRPAARPASPPSEPKYNVVELLTKGNTLSKVQARSAFAMYLVRVQQRLMTDCNAMTQDDMDGLNEQMDLVLRFLKRAAVNLQQSFKVVVPSRKLPLTDRRRILAKQLGDFVHIYNKSKFSCLRLRRETEQLRARRHLERKHSHIHRTESTDGLDDDKFDRFVHTASEGELEEVLTTYTKINKSASIFLGGKTGETTVSHVPTTGITRSQYGEIRVQANNEGNSMQHIGASTHMLHKSDSQTSLNKRKDSFSGERGGPQPPKTVTGWEEVPRAIHSVPTSSSDLRSQHQASPSHGSHGYGSRPATYSTNSAASYASAVQIYTQKLSTLRPRSATSAGQKTEKLRSRPSSAHMTNTRPMSATQSAYGSTPDLQDPYNEKVITEALQRLTMRQQARQYSVVNSTSLVPSEYSRPSSASGPREHVETQKLLIHDTNPSKPPHHQQTTSIDKGPGGCGDPGVQLVHSGKYISVEDSVTKNRPPSGLVPKRTQSAHAHTAIDLKSIEAHRKKQSNVNLQSANATFNSFIEDNNPNTWQNELAMAYNQVTGVTPQNYHAASQSSKQYQIIQQQQALKQQSKVLLEQSKAKHQAMIAQAHAVQKSLHTDLDPGLSQMYAPKPPTKPGVRKTASAHTRMPKRTVPEETSLNFQFFTSNKPATNGGELSDVVDDVHDDDDDIKIKGGSTHSKRFSYKSNQVDKKVTKHWTIK